MKKKLVLAVFSLLLTVASVEIFLHLFVQPSPDSYGVLFGKDLPPKKLIPSAFFEEVRTKYVDRQQKTLPDRDIAPGERPVGVTRRADELIGYTNNENVVSDDNIFRSNNLGAKSDVYITREKPPGKERILFFGDSFTECSGLPPEETFSHFIEESDSSVEAVNFGVSGYSTGQAYLRFKSLKGKLEFDRAILVFVPYADLWRDINVDRFVGDNWKNWGLIMPRFVIDDGSLALVRSPYKTLQEFMDENEDAASPRLREHLKRYDDFYRWCLHEAQPVLDFFITYKLLKLKYCNHFEAVDKFDLIEPGSDAMKITKKIIEEMAEEVRAEGAEFSLVILPVRFEINEYKTNPAYREDWDEMSSYICSGGYECFDLMPDFLKVPFESLDASPDFHNGPVTNGYVADFILNRLAEDRITEDVPENE